MYISTFLDAQEPLYFKLSVCRSVRDGGRRQAVRERGVVVDAGGVCFPFAEEEEGYSGERRQGGGGGEHRLIGLGKGGGGEH